ncbi:MAG: hypothetical protein QXO67_00785 [Candidatus Bathyarchaeia archaeon]
MTKIRRHELSLSNLEVVGSTDVCEHVHVPFMPDHSTTPRTINLRKSKDGKVYAVVWNVGSQAYSKVFKSEEEARQFYREAHLRLIEDARAEAAEIRARLQQQYNESWLGSQKTLYHKGFRVRVIFSENQQPVKINTELGLVEGECPFCKTLQVFDAKESLQRFLENLDNFLEGEGVMPSHSGRIVERGISVRSRCPECFSYPELDFEAQAGKGLLKRLKQKRGESKIGE